VAAQEVAPVSEQPEQRGWRRSSGGTAHAVLLGRLPLPERNFVADALRTETVGGVLLLLATVIALIWSNTFPHSYGALVGHHFGPSVLGLRLTTEHWAADGLLAVFFFVAGVEVKRELVAGELREPTAAALPVIASVSGVLIPAALYVLVNALGGGAFTGWAIPTTTDIAFALAVLAVIGTALPSALRAFLLTSAVVDDLIAILVIAVFFTESLDIAALIGAVAALAVFRLLHHMRVRGWYAYLPLALVIWALTYNSGVHATIAGVAMGLMVPCTPREGEERTLGERLEHMVRPVSAGLAVPMFALLSAGVSISAASLKGVFDRPEALGVVVGLVLGKSLGIFGGTWLAARFTRARLNPALRWPDVLAVACLAGIGFTVSLLISELAFGQDPRLTEKVKAAVLVGSVISAVVAAALLKLRNNVYRGMYEEENRDEDEDGIPDVYEQDTPAYHLRMAEILERKAAEHRRLAQVARDGGAGEDP
jgi:Na+:H+ antiporter, NhaA family